MSGQWEYARLISRIESRVTSVERRLRDAIGDAIKFFIDLEDVKARTDEHAPLVAGDVWGLNIDGEWDIITPAGSDSTPFVSMRAIASQYDPDPFAGFTAQWSYDGDDSALELAAIGAGGSRGILVGAAGIYRVTAAGESDSALKVAISGPSWMWDGESDVCRSNYAADEGGDCAAVSMDFAMPEGGAVVVTHTTSGTWVELSLLVELRHLDPSIVVGECGG